MSVRTYFKFTTAPLRRQARKRGYLRLVAPTTALRRAVIFSCSRGLFGLTALTVARPVATCRSCARHTGWALAAATIMLTAQTCEGIAVLQKVDIRNCGDGAAFFHDSLLLITNTLRIFSSGAENSTEPSSSYCLLLIEATRKPAFSGAGFCL